MPPKRQRKRNKAPIEIVEAKAPLVGSFAETLSSAPAPLDPLQCLTMLKKGMHPRKLGLISDTDGFELVIAKDAKSSTESKEILPELKVGLTLLKNLVRSIYKPDHPYRTLVNIHGTLATSAAGVLNNTLGTTSITSTAEWSSIDSLFDEFFIHSFTCRFFPFNAVGGGYSTAGVAGTLTNASPGVVTSCGLIVVSLFSSGAAYGTAQAMGNNPTKAYHMTNKPWKYMWRNNIKFQPRGPTDTSSSTQGWVPIASASSYGGQMQMRTVNDQVIGDATHAVVLGSVSYEYDVSFRARS